MTFNKGLLTPCPVLTPTTEEFANPIEYLSRSDTADIGAKYGIVKVVPPKGWKPPFLISADFKFHTRHQKLSDLGLTTRSRKFFNDNINRFLKMTRKKPLKMFFDVREAGIRVYYYDLYVAVEKYGDFEKMTSDQWEKINEKFGAPYGSNYLKEKYQDRILSYAKYLSANNKNFEFPESDSEDDEANCLICGKHNLPTQTLLCDNCDNPFHMRCLLPPLTEIPRGAWYCDKCLIGTGEYGFEEPVEIKYSLPQFYNMCLEFEKEFVDKYNDGKPLTVDSIEQKFWEFVDIQKSDLEVKYGADIHNLTPGQISGFPMANTPNLTQEAETQKYINHPFNLTKLPFAEGSLLNFINTSISGMTVPWIYIGSLLSTFCWHVEDHYTLSANYCHMGATKKWYGIPSEFADKFETLMKDSAPDLFKRQPDLLHQLVTLLSPNVLVKNGIPCVYVDQQPNEFVVTYPRVYHAGFNCGFNFNEAVNFTMPQWLEFGEQSIKDYKLIKKENVFNHYQLVENILKQFNGQKGKISLDQIAMVTKCITSFENYYKEQSDLLAQIDKDKFTKVLQPKIYKERKFSEEQMGTFKEEDEDDEDDELCDFCRSKVSHQYCLVDNSKHKLHKLMAAPQVKKEEVFEPQTPQLSSDAFTRISINQLLTPESSPADESKPVPDYRRSYEIAESELSKRLEKTPDFDEWERLIANAKRSSTDEEEEQERKRRRSSRRQKVEGEPVPEKKIKSGRMSKMTVVQQTSNLRQLNEKEEIKFCLLCCLKQMGPGAERAPPGSKLVFETPLDRMKDLIRECKRNLQELNV